MLQRASMTHSGRLSGMGFLEDAGNAVNGFLKDSHIISNALPWVGTTLGSALDPVIGPAGTALGGIVGTSLGNVARSHGYGEDIRFQNSSVWGGGGGPVYDFDPALTNGQGYVQAFNRISPVRIKNIEIPYDYKEPRRIYSF